MNRPFHRALAAIVWPIAIALLGGCSFDSARPASCSSQAQCFDDEICLRNTCKLAANHPDAGGQTDRDADLNETSGGGNDNNTSTPVGKCVVNPLTTTCDDPEAHTNNSRVEAASTNSNKAVGCLDQGFESLDRSVSRVICATELEDWYSLNMVTCREQPFFIELKLTVKNGCDLADIELVAGNQGYDCSHEDVYCPEAVGATQRMIVRVPVALRNDARAFYWAVRAKQLASPREALQIEYDMSVRVYLL